MNECSRGPLSQLLYLSTDDVHSSSAEAQLTASAEIGPFYSFPEMDLLHAFLCMAIGPMHIQGGTEAVIAKWGERGSQVLGNCLKRIFNPTSENRQIFPL